MSEFLPVLIFFIAIVSLIFLLYHIIRLLSLRSAAIDRSIGNQKANDALLRLDDIIRGAVNATNQRVVNHLKKTDSFFQLDKDEAFNQTRWYVLNTLREQDLKDLTPYFSDINEWINNRIEYHVRMEKNNN